MTVNKKLRGAVRWIRHKWLRRRRFALVSSAIYREHQAVRRGISHYEEEQRSGEHRYYLRRNIHMIEKGLTMVPRRETFAVDYIRQTVNAAATTCAGSDQSVLTIQESNWVIGVLRSYFEATASSDSSEILLARSDFCKAFGNDKSYEIRVGPHAHSGPVDSPIKISDLWAVAEGRRSVRWFRDERVERDLVDRAVAVASESPTACNRAPYRFDIFDDPDRSRRIAAIAMGTAGYSHQVQGLVVVVGKLSAFFDERDRHLIYIDSSLAAMSFVLGLEVQGVASCIINWPDVPEREKRMRRELKLAAEDRVVMLVAYGYASSDGLVPISAKSDLNSVRRYLV